MRIALFVDRGTEASEFRKEFAGIDDDYQVIDGEDIRNGVLQNFDALVIPGGSATRESKSMGPAARDEIRNFIKKGGIYLGVCAGSYLASSEYDVYLGLLPLKTIDNEHWLRTTGTPALEVELTSLGMEIFGIKRKNIQIVYEDGPVFAPPFAENDNEITPLGFFRSEVVAPGGEKGVMINTPAIILAKYGSGRILLISPHPEETPGLKKVELHALHWLYEHKSAVLSATSTAGGTVPVSSSRTGRSSESTARHSSASTAGRSAPQDLSSQDSRLQDSKPQGNAQFENSALSAQAVKLAQLIFDRATDVRYSHRDKIAARQVITDDDGSVEARTDCSGFISYLIHSIAPRHYSEVRKREPDASYPQAKIWARFFDSLDCNQPQNGWLGICNWKDLKPGDFIAWVEGKPLSSSDGNTGHVMMAMAKPSEIKQDGEYRYFEILVMDSSSIYHFAPEQLPPNAHQNHRNGIGIGTVRIILNPAGEPTGYWAGTYWGEGQKQIRRPTLSDLVRFGRMLPNLQG